MSQQIWIGTEPNPNDRLIITISEADAQKVLPEFIDGIVEVTDVTTDKQYRVQRADCGLGCRCALELAPEEKKNVQVVIIETITLRAKETRNAKPRMYLHHSDETIADSLAGRRNRPIDIYQKFFPKIEEALGMELGKTRWSQKAGCSCPCSPGFILEELAGFPCDVHVSLKQIELAPDMQHTAYVVTAVPDLKGKFYDLRIALRWIGQRNESVAEERSRETDLIR